MWILHSKCRKNNKKASDLTRINQRLLYFCVKLLHCMKSTEITREEMWAKQHLSANEIDYAIWEQDKVVLQQMSQISRSCSFVVDVYKYRYAFASSNFADILGYDSRRSREIIWNHAFIRTISPDWSNCRLTLASSSIACLTNKEMIIVISIVSGWWMPNNSTYG